ncbi:hypothetical protein FSARC_5287 [Fusarium sarcochroum]|uniref:Cytochrome P450 monooxygenase n=1 Tax=Fusarium sarcochroum TaxID=1208366 RepID=A0A8H4XAL0_9HYPO|nr:hypothetical protein FSARC_5287 [Fusarium sarcochroum]
MAAEHGLYFLSSVSESAGDLVGIVFSLHFLFSCSSVAVAIFILWTVTSYFTSPLRKYPGPFLARFTRLWYMYQVYTGNSHLVLERLHKKYGPIVRIGPNFVDIDKPEIIPNVFALKEDWQKTKFYHASSALVNGQTVYNIFSETDPAQHKRERQPISRFYSSASIRRKEPVMNNVIKELCKQLEGRYVDGENANQDCDLGQWILFYTWDVVGITTYSQPMGYLESGCDFDGTLHIANKAMDYFALVGTVPWLDKVFDKNPVWRMGPPGFSTVTDISIKRLEDRLQGKDGDHHSSDQTDFLDHFISVRNANRDKTSLAQTISWLMVNMIAGADTTAIAIRSVLYFGLKHPQIWKRLTEEILKADFRGQTPPPYQKVKELPYTDAVVREALRILPGVSMSMERYVPKGGFILPDGDFLPGGTIVGMNPYILGRNKEVYGNDADQFCPDRWLRNRENGEADARFKERLAAMNQADLSFGCGSRNCLGRNVGLYQIYKVLATLITLYVIELVDPEKEWKVTNSWFPRQEGLEVRIRKRSADRP